ncbi:MAG: 4'-phosphopantetheinyl transferase superfamily protein [Clostridiales bacterium]|nr:4'-phosphopantetheinyl transferase superfamily protein [Clostridiales bacterium]
MVELFAADIRQIAPNAPKLIALLDRERQARVRALGDSRAALLSLAAGLLLYDAFGEGTRSVRFEHGRRGKPHLPDRTPFNITHAGDYAVLALSTQSVGVDLEQIRPIDWQKIANRFFHPEERRYLAGSASPQADFFRIWTLKESFLKAEGLGFSISPASFGVLPEGDTGARMTCETAYRFTRFPAFEGYCLSVCSLERDVAAGVVMRSF